MPYQKTLSHWWWYKETEQQHINNSLTYYWKLKQQRKNSFSNTQLPEHKNWTIQKCFFCYCCYAPMLVSWYVSLNTFSNREIGLYCTQGFPHKNDNLQARSASKKKFCELKENHRISNNLMLPRLFSCAIPSGWN